MCVNEDQLKKDPADREALVAALREQLRQGDQALIGNKGYRRYVKGAGASHCVVAEAKLDAEAQYDGTWVLRTNTDLSAAAVALPYKKLWQVEHWFRSCKSLLETRPIYHRCDETIRGHVFGSFLALLLRDELQRRRLARGHTFEGADVLADLERLQPVAVAPDGQRFLLRSAVQGTCGHVCQAVGVALPPTVQQLTE